MQGIWCCVSGGGQVDFVSFSIYRCRYCFQVYQSTETKKIQFEISDYVLFAPPILAAKLAGLFKALIHHRHTPQCIRDSTIPKVLRVLLKSGNYRGVALASCFSKLLELCILLMFPEYFNTSGLQFGFKKGFSTDFCTRTLKIVTSHYKQRGGGGLKLDVLCWT